MMKKVLQTVQCTHCNLISQSPLLLPCGKSVCRKHLTDITTITTKTHEFYCHGCQVRHAIPPDGFTANDACELLIATHFGERHQAALNACHKLEACIVDLDTLQSDPAYRVRELIGEMRREVEVRRDELKSELDERARVMICELDEFVNECVETLEARRGLIFDDEAAQAVRNSVWSEMGGGGAVGEVNLDRLKIDVNEWLHELNKLENNSQTKWKAILERSEAESRELAGKIDQMKNYLLLGRLDEFKEKQTQFCQLRLVSVGSSLVDWPIDTDPISSEIQNKNFTQITDFSYNENQFDDYNECEENVADESMGGIFSLNSWSNNNKRKWSDSNEQNDCEDKPVVGELSQEEVEQIYNSGEKSVKNFAARLLRRYFSKSELLADNTNVLGITYKKMPKNGLDPVRLGYIRKHILDFDKIGTGHGFEDDEQCWKVCVEEMNMYMRVVRYRYKNSKQNQINQKWREPMPMSISNKRSNNNQKKN